MSLIIINLNSFFRAADINKRSPIKTNFLKQFSHMKTDFFEKTYTKLVAQENIQIIKT